MRAWQHIYKSGLLVLLAWATGCAAAYADERILSFDETVTVNADGSLYVRERIRVRAEGRNIRRGIYRDFPTTYSGSDGHRYVVDFAFQGASRDGKTEQWHAENRGNGVRIYIGNPSELVRVGETPYELVFALTASWATLPITMSCTGTSRATADLSIASRRVERGDPPAEIKPRRIPGRRARRGRTTRPRCRPADRCSYHARTSAQEGLTIVAMWPKGFISRQSSPRAARGARANYMNDDGRSGWSRQNVAHKDLPNQPPARSVSWVWHCDVYYYYVWARVGRDRQDE
jgi:hypothetical protein